MRSFLVASLLLAATLAVPAPAEGAALVGIPGRCDGVTISASETCQSTCLAAPGYAEMQVYGVGTGAVSIEAWCSDGELSASCSGTTVCSGSDNGASHGLFTLFCKVEGPPPIAYVCQMNGGSLPLDAGTAAAAEPVLGPALPVPEPALDAQALFAPAGELPVGWLLA